MSTPSVPCVPDLLEIYGRFRDIVSRHDHVASRELLSMLAKALESRRKKGDTVLNEIVKLMSCLDLAVDSRQFNYFYDFVFFICRENGQKNISVNRAISAWKIVLTGRFRLLNQWCDFVERHQRHNISEDTWQQLLAFSRCVNEDLKGYDPKGAWPVLIDDFVDQMYRINKPIDCGSTCSCCSCADLEKQPSISSTFQGLNLHPGSKRKDSIDFDGYTEEAPNVPYDSTSLIHFMKPKRLKPTPAAKKLESWEAGFAKCVVAGNNSLSCVHISACSVEDSLSKGFEGNLSLRRCFQLDQDRVSYT